MPNVSFSGLVVVCAVAFLAPLFIGALRGVRVPAVVVEIVLGIAIGPSGLNWVHDDVAVAVLGVLGLAFLLFLAGLEVDLGRLRGRLLRLPALGFLASLALALGVGGLLTASGLVRSPLLIGITLVATSLGLVVPVLKDAGEASSDFGQLVIAGGTVADFGAVVLLTLFFSGEASGLGAKVVLLAAFVAAGLVSVLAFPLVALTLLRSAGGDADARVVGSEPAAVERM